MIKRHVRKEHNLEVEPGVYPVKIIYPEGLQESDFVKSTEPNKAHLISEDYSIYDDDD